MARPKGSASFIRPDGELPPQSPLYMNRDDVLASLGYQATGYQAKQSPQKPATPMTLGLQTDACHRCGKKVYPVEKLDIGVLYHRGCFKCHVCSMQLTLRNFHREVDLGSSKTKEVYCQAHVPKLTKGHIGLDALGIRSPMDAQKMAAEKRKINNREHHYDQNALEFQHSSEIKRRKKVKRRSTLKSFQDFEKFGVFDAQTALEKVHREEEDELYRQMYEERKQQRASLEKALNTEKKKTVKELVAWFETQDTPPREREAGLAKVEQYFKHQREERSRILLQRLADEEQAAVARLIEKQSQEMLFMIANKEKQATLTLKRERKKSKGRSVDGPAVTRPDDSSSKTSGTKSSGSGSGRPRTPGSSSGQRTEIRTAGATITVVAPDGNVSVSNQDLPSIQEQADDARGRANGPPRSAAASSSRQSVSSRKPSQHSGSSQSLNQRQRRQKSAGDQDPEAEGSRKIPAKHVPPARRRKNSYEDAMDHQKAAFPVTIVPPTLKFLPPGAGASSEASTVWDESSSSSEGVYEVEDIENVINEGRDRQQRKRQRGQQPPHQQPSQKQAVPHRVAPPPPRGRHQESESEETSSEEEYSDESDSEEDDLASMASMQPAVVPPKTAKATLHATPEVFRELDQQAIEETKRDHHTFTELVRHLTKRCQSDLQRVRALFRWITAKDLNKIQFTKTMDADSPMGLLRGIKYGTETYHNLFKRLCSYAALHCEVIEGYSKGAGYRPGTRFKGNVFRNQWTAVWVDDSWRFINSNWGARHVKGRKDEVLTYKCDEFYFLTDPEDHIYQHLPHDATWQLMKNQISMDDFVRLPVVKSPFFNSKLSFFMKYPWILQATDGTVEIKLIAPRLVGFAASLKSRDGQVPNEILQNRSCIRAMDKEIIFLVNLPTPGKYVMDIFVSRQLTSDTMDNACSFQIYCSGVSPNPQLSFPPEAMFGRTPVFAHLGLAERSHRDPYIQASGRLVLRFATSTEVKLSHTLKYWNHRDGRLEDMDRQALAVHRDNNLVTYLLLCPRKGNYAFSLCAGRPESESGDLECVYRYLVECRAPPEHPFPMPKASKRWRHCELLEPLSGVLTTRSRVRFRIRSEAAVEIVMYLNGTWIPLAGNTPDRVWQGSVHMGEKDGKATVFGRFGKKTEKYIPLLEYNVKTPSMSDEVKMLYKYL